MSQRSLTLTAELSDWETRNTLEKERESEDQCVDCLSFHSASLFFIMIYDFYMISAFAVFVLPALSNLLNKNLRYLDVILLQYPT